MDVGLPTNVEEERIRSQLPEGRFHFSFLLLFGSLNILFAKALYNRDGLTTDALSVLSDLYAGVSTKPIFAQLYSSTDSFYSLFCLARHASSVLNPRHVVSTPGRHLVVLALCANKGALSLKNPGLSQRSC